MRKDTPSQGLVGTTAKKGMPLRHQIDFFGSIILLTNIYIVSLLFASASTNYLYLSIPNELLIHGPIVLNVTNTKLTAKPIICNPHFELFRNNYLSEEIKNQEEVKSSSYLAIPEVNELLDDINRVQNRSVTTFGMSPNGLCELIPPANDWGDCITLDQYKVCLKGDCGTDANFCFWDNSRIVNFCAYAQILMYTIAVLMTFGLMFDPPPAKFALVLSPKICAGVYLVSGVSSLAGLVTCVFGVSRYASDAMYSTYSKFYVSYDAGWQCFLFTSLASASFAICYLYLGCFTPRYPRQPNRWDLRRKNFVRSLDHIKEKVSQEV